MSARPSTFAITRRQLWVGGMVILALSLINAIDRQAAWVVGGFALCVASATLVLLRER